MTDTNAGASHGYERSRRTRTAVRRRTADARHRSPRSEPPKRGTSACGRGRGGAESLLAPPR
jgi:hypothetical protein